MKDGEREATAKVVASVWGTYCNVEFNRFLQIYRGKKYSTAMNWTNSATQTDAKTFAFASLSILLLCEGGSLLYCILFPKWSEFPHNNRACLIWSRCNSKYINVLYCRGKHTLHVVLKYQKLIAFHFFVTSIIIFLKDVFISWLKFA